MVQRVERTMAAVNDVDAALRDAREALRRAIERLAAADARQEALGEYLEPRGVLGIRKRPTMRRLGSAWRLGALLVAPDASLWATGLSTRVVEPGRPQHLHSAAEIRRAYRAAALQGGFALGETVNHDIEPLTLDASLAERPRGPLLIAGSSVLVREGQDAPVPFERYLDDRVELLVHPSAGA